MKEILLTMEKHCVILPMEFMLKQQLTLIMQGILATKFLKTWPELVSEYSFKRKNQAVTLASKIGCQN